MSINYDDLELSLQYLDLCLPDYFQGCAGTYLAVPVGPDTTVQDIKEGLLAEWNNVPDGTDLLQYDEDWLCVKFTDAVNKLYPSLPGSAVFKAVRGLDKENENSQSSYLYMQVVVR